LLDGVVHDYRAARPHFVLCRAALLYRRDHLHGYQRLEIALCNHFQDRGRPGAMNTATRIKMDRTTENPLITPRDVKPTFPDWEVLGAFNAGVIEHGEEIIML